ncbi:MULTISPECIES: HD domain-containing protein [Clostridium]|uniref:HD domain-containing protein n=1 Tax=Clostridium frigoriphilum TaxID=443253 RepID=A0ABU7UWA2_9CLOT|nr:HD domain-containing protein [Clostridium sp. DSM 17811]
MKYKNAIFECIEYIEENIKEELTIELLANEVGYSVYHFSRIFTEQMGMPLMEYVRERRLICASKYIFDGKKILDVSIEFGFKTHSGFSKAFKKKFGFTPTQHVIYAIHMSNHMFNEKGDRYVMTDNSTKPVKNIQSDNANPFLKSSVDFTKPEELYRDLAYSFKKNHSSDDLIMVEKAYHLAYKAHDGQYRKSGEPYIIHPLCVALILSEMESDTETIIAGLFHDIVSEGTLVTIDKLTNEFSNEIAQLVDQVTKFKKISWDLINKDDNKVDHRVILIKFADRLHNMRTLKYMQPEKWMDKAKETIDIFSPIAAHLGISKIKTELDDLSLKYL